MVFHFVASNSTSVSTDTSDIEEKCFIYVNFAAANSNTRVHSISIIENIHLMLNLNKQSPSKTTEKHASCWTTVQKKEARIIHELPNIQIFDDR